MNISNPYAIFNDLSGRPLEAGMIYIGVANQNPETNPIAVYWDSALTQPAAQPLKTIGGMIARDGNIASAYVSADFSITVRNKHGNLIFNAPYIKNSDLINSSLVTIIQNGVGSVVRFVFDKLNESCFSVKDFGAVGDGLSNDSLAISNANYAAQLLKKSLYFPSGTYNLGKSSFTIDVSKANWIANDLVSLKWSAEPSLGYGLELISTASYLNFWNCQKDILKGFAILGGDTSALLFNATGVKIGNGIDETANLTLDHISIQGWTNNIDFQSQVWSISLKKCRLLWGSITTPSVPVNFGECMVFDDCFISDGVVINLNGGDWKFSKGSLDNSTVIINNDTVVHAFGQHLENPGSTASTFLFYDVAGSTSYCGLHGCSINLSNPGSGIQDGLFRVNSSNTESGLFINGLSLPQFSYFNSNINDDYTTLVRSGGGRVVAKGVSPFSTSNFYFWMLSDYLNKFGNGGFEESTLSNWTISGIATQDSSIRFIGKRITSLKSLKLSVSSVSTYASALQKVSCSPGDFVSVQGFRISDSISGHYGSTRLQFFDSSGGVLKTIAYNAFSQSTDWTLWKASSIAPKGCVSVGVLLDASFSSLSGDVWFDEFVINVI